MTLYCAFKISWAGRLTENEKVKKH